MVRNTWAPRYKFDWEFTWWPNKSVSGTIRISLIDAQLHANTANVCITLHFPRGSTSDVDGTSTKGEDVVDPVGST